MIRARHPAPHEGPCFAVRAWTGVRGTSVVGFADEPTRGRAAGAERRGGDAARHTRGALGSRARLTRSARRLRLLVRPLVGTGDRRATARPGRTRARPRPRVVCATRRACSPSDSPRRPPPRSRRSRAAERPAAASSALAWDRQVRSWLPSHRSRSAVRRGEAERPTAPDATLVREHRKWTRAHEGSVAGAA